MFYDNYITYNKKEKFSVKDGTIQYEDLNVSKLNYVPKYKDNLSSWSKNFAQSKDGRVTYEMTVNCEKEMVDADVFLSQVYANLGFVTPIYCPVSKDGKVYACCNGLKNFVNAKAFNKDINFSSSRLEKEHLFLSGNINKSAAKHHSKDTYADTLLMRFMDIACGITSRTSDDMGYICGGMFSKSKTVVPTTYCISGYNYLNRDNKKNDMNEEYFSEFSINRQKKEQLIESYMNSKDARKILPRIDVYHFIKEIDNLDYKQIAKEIKDNIHYEVDAGYVKYLEEQKQEFCKLIDEKCKLGYFDKKLHKQNDEEQEF